MARRKARRLNANTAVDIFAGTKEHDGLLWATLGFHTSTGKFQAAHLMNDLAQTVCAGAPGDGGDFLCRVIRDGVEYASEGNSLQELRADSELGARFNRAFPPALKAQTVADLRLAARRLLNDDKAVFRAGDRMTSPTATNKALLGFEGFRRFAVGRYFATLLEDAGQRRIAQLFSDSSDPVSQALSPLFSPPSLEWKDTHPDLSPPTLTEFDAALGEGLRRLLDQPLSKPTLLRFLALATSLGLVLKTLGGGRPGCRPTVLALPARDAASKRSLREAAVQTFRAGMDALMAALCAGLSKHPLADALWEEEAGADSPAIVVREANLATAASQVAGELREYSGRRGPAGGPQLDRALQWPDEFAEKMGVKAGCVHPPNNRAGWGKYLALTPEHLEVLVLMFVPRGSAPVQWHSFWQLVSAKLGIVIGADAHADAAALRAAGALHVEQRLLKENSHVLLEYAIGRGVARRLPDSGAEVGGGLQ